MIHLTISLNNIPEVVTYDVIEKLYLEVTALNYVDGDLVGNLQCTKAYQDSVQYLTTHFPNLSINITVSPYIRFADLEVLRICTAQYGDGIGCTTADAASVSSFPENFFSNNTTITSLNDLQYFTGASTITLNFAKGCTNLTSVIIPLGTTVLSSLLGDPGLVGAFKGCTNLTNVQLPEGLLEIGNAFSDCTSLSTIDIPSTVTKLANNISNYGYCFNSCTGLTSITGGEGVTIIGQNAFQNCTSLESLGDIDLSAVTFIGAACFKKCSNLDITLPQLSSITNIGFSAFEQCGKISGAVNAPNLTYVGQSAFASTGITAVLSLGSVTEIPISCFERCKSLTSANISGITNIREYSFHGCDLLSNLTIPQSLKLVGVASFIKCPNLLLSVNDIQNIETFGGYREAGWIIDPKSSLVGQTPLISGTTLSLPNAKVIRDNAFCKQGFTTINIPNLLRLFGFGTFEGNTNLTSVTLGGTFTQIEGDFVYGTRGMFEGCTSLQTVTITAPIIHISTGMFADTGSSITQLNIDFDKITNIDTEAFVNFNPPNFVLNFKNVTTLSGERKSRNYTPYMSVFHSMSNISIYLPKLINIDNVVSTYQHPNQFRYGAFFNYERGRNYNNAASQYNTIYLKDVEKIAAGTFAGVSVHTLVINNTQIPTIIASTNSTLTSTYPTFNTDMFCEHGIIDNIYVPDSVVSNYQADPAFSSMASIIKPISQCPTVTLAQQKAGNVGVISDYM